MLYDMNSIICSIFMIVLGFALIKYPPKSRNNMYGYKSHLAKKNQDTRDVSQKHSGFSMIIAGIINGLLGSWSIIKPMSINGNSMQLVFLLLSIIIILIIEELHLTKLFNKGGSRKK